MNIFIKDQLRQNVEIASDGHETILYDDLNLPNVMVIIPQFKINKMDTSRASIISYDFSATPPYIVIGNNFSDHYDINNDIIVYMYINGYDSRGFVKLKPASNLILNGKSITKHEIEFINSEFTKGNNEDKVNTRIIDSNSNPLGTISYLPKAMSAASSFYECDYDPETQQYTIPANPLGHEDDEENNSVNSEIYPAFKRGELYTDKIFISKYRSRNIGNYKYPISYNLKNEFFSDYYKIPNNIDYIENLMPIVSKKGKGWHIMNIWEQTIMTYIYNNLNNIYTSELDFLKNSISRIKDTHVPRGTETNYPYTTYIPEIIDGISLNARSEFEINDQGFPRVFEYYKDNDVGYKLNNDSYDLNCDKWVRNCLAGITISNSSGQTITSHSDPNILKLNPSGGSNLRFNDIQDITRNNNYINQIPKEFKKDLMLMGIDGELDRISRKNKHRRIGFYENYDNDNNDFMRSVCYSGIILNKTLNRTDDIDNFDPSNGVYRENPSDLYFGFLLKKEFDVHVRFCYI